MSGKDALTRIRASHDGGSKSGPPDSFDLLSFRHFLQADKLPVVTAQQTTGGR